MNSPTEPGSLGELLTEVMDRRGYRSLSELARQTTIPYQTLWSWSKGTRAHVRPPAPQVLRTFAKDFAMPEAVVFRASGRAYFESEELDDDSITVLDALKSLSQEDHAALVRMVDLFRAMSPYQRAIAKNVLEGIAEARQSKDSDS